MPRVSREQAARHHEKIVETAARLFREQGLHGIGVADLMHEAGLTHGGFYGHFESKQALSAAACTHSFEQTVEHWNALVARQQNTPGAAARRFIRSYLSPHHCANPGAGCAIPTLAADIAREALDSPVRQAFAHGMQRMVDLVGALLPSSRIARRRHEQALLLMASLVGAVVIARATAGDPLSDEILAAVAQGTHALLEP